MQLFTNNAESSLDGGILSGTTVITVKAGEGGKFPSPASGDFFLVTLFQKVGATELNHEIVRCTSRTGDVLTVVRGQEGTVAKEFNNGDAVELRLTAGTAASMFDNSTDDVAISYNPDGSVATLTEDGLTKTFAYNADGTIKTISWPVGSLTRTETYSYSSGVLTGMTAVEA